MSSPSPPLTSICLLPPPTLFFSPSEVHTLGSAPSSSPTRERVTSPCVDREAPPVHSWRERTERKTERGLLFLLFSPPADDHPSLRGDTQKKKRKGRHAARPPSMPSHVHTQTEAAFVRMKELPSPPHRKRKKREKPKKSRRIWVSSRGPFSTTLSPVCARVRRGEGGWRRWGTMITGGKFVATLLPPSHSRSASAAMTFANLRKICKFASFHQ